jgi:pimeloyl-ACP methyl ester carboxylesterase
VTVDLPGHGLSPYSPGLLSMEAMAGSVKKVLEALNISTCVLVGHSMGGYVALAFAKAYPESVKGLVLFHSHAAADPLQFRQNRDRTIAMVKEDHAGFIRRFIPELFAPENVPLYQDEIIAMSNAASVMSPLVLIGCLEGIRDRGDHRAFLSATDIPVLFIAGKKDVKVPFSFVMEQLPLPKHAEALILGDVGHMGFIEAARETLATVRCFAEKVW